MRFHTQAVRRSIGIRWLSVYEVQPRIGAQVKTLAFQLTSHRMSFGNSHTERDSGSPFG